MGVIIYSFNLNISPKVSYAVLECDVVMYRITYDFVIKDFVIKRALFVGIFQHLVNLKTTGN